MKRREQPARATRWLASRKGKDCATSFKCAVGGSVVGNSCARVRADRGHSHPDRLHPRWLVGHIVGGKKDAKVFVPSAIAVTFTDTKGQVTTTSESITKHDINPKQTVWTISGTNLISGGSLQVTGSVTGVFH